MTYSPLTILGNVSTISVDQQNQLLANAKAAETAWNIYVDDAGVDSDTPITLNVITSTGNEDAKTQDFFNILPNGLALPDGRANISFNKDSYFSQTPEQQKIVMEHEFGHVLGISGTLDGNGHPVISTISIYDSHVDAKTMTFHSDQTDALFPGGVNLNLPFLELNSRPYHVNVPGDLLQPTLNGNESITMLDVALVAAGGANVRPQTWLFDPAYYNKKNPDVMTAGVDPLQHYNTFGWHEGRDLNLLFSTSDYFRDNPDVAAAGVNPYQHYLTFGMKEGRKI